jgi:Icc-related predicted phosphoesterase
VTEKSIKLGCGSGPDARKSNLAQTLRYSYGSRRLSPCECDYMRVLASADLHGEHSVYTWLVRTASKHRVDAVVLAGDLLGCPDGFSTPEQAQRHEARQVSECLEGAGLPVFYIMGNDDLVELQPGSERVQSVNGRRVQWGQYAVVGYQYSLPFMGGPFEKSEESISLDVMTLEELLDAGTIFVSHSPALGILDSGIGETYIGSRSLRDLLLRNPVRAHIHGHSHASFGRHGFHLNVASAGRERAMLLDLKTMEHQVVRGLRS